MKLLEYEGKALLARHGIPVAAGALWPRMPESASGWVVKAQVLAGGRVDLAGRSGRDLRRRVGGHHRGQIAVERAHTASVNWTGSPPIG